MTDDLAAFITARLEEDERGAQFMKERENGVEVPVTNWLGVPFADRMLREVAAIRAIVRWHPSERMRYIDASRCPQCELTWPCPTIRVIAAAWSDHPDYRAEWQL